MKIVIIAAMDEAQVIGKQGKIPWRLPKDFKRFKRITLGKPIIMGRLTWADIGRPLPGRTNIILSRNPDFHAPGCLTASSLKDALNIASQESEEVTIAGGQHLYAQALPQATDLRLTKVHTMIEEGDTFFPPWDASQWKKTFHEHHNADKNHPHAWTWTDWVKAT